ncbi:putative DMT superfamily transporter inner membrane protein [Halalkalicoccus paucihalophilus]|uniref:Putative DMT superfamily transporter inner membrane protein n=1 Tax=Halalkalicoccus paucihalophilus TaxID=1008153 RepID=A0A151AAR5_9EURY|nr:putative DMT superfamily transporter inner membrane protein [Halalkalicoccus paucihalophilus]
MWNQWSESATAVGSRFTNVCVIAEQYRGGLLFAIVALVMGVGYVAIGVGTETVPPPLLAAFRFDASASILLTYAFVRGRWRPRTTADVLAIVVLGEFVLAGTVGFLFAGQQYITVSIAAVVMGLGPIVTVPFAYLLVPGERLSRADLVGVALGFCGVAIVANPLPAEATTGSAVGIAFICCAVLSSSLGGVLLSRLETDLSMLSLTGWGALLGGVTLHLVSVGLGETGGAIAWTPTSIAALVYLGVVVGIGGYTALLSLLAEVGPTRTSLTSFASPVVAIIAGWLVLGEAVTVLTLVGFLVVTVGFVVLNRGDFGSVLESIRR